MGLSDEIKSLRKNVDIEVILMTCGIIVFVSILNNKINEKYKN